MPGMQRLLDSFSDQPFRILAINDSEPRRRVERMVERLGVDFTVLLDANGSAMSASGIKVLPTSFVVDQAGRVRYRVVGPYDWDGETGRQVVEDLLREKGSAARDSRSE
jgi:peroxiredoxin